MKLQLVELVLSELIADFLSIILWDVFLFLELWSFSEWIFFQNYFIMKNYFLIVSNLLLPLFDKPLELLLSPGKISVPDPV
jgi:hypothetical protein